MFKHSRSFVIFLVFAMLAALGYLLWFGIRPNQYTGNPSTQPGIASTSACTRISSQQLQQVFGSDTTWKQWEPTIITSTPLYYTSVCEWQQTSGVSVNQYYITVEQTNYPNDQDWMRAWNTSTQLTNDVPSSTVDNVGDRAVYRGYAVENTGAQLEWRKDLSHVIIRLRSLNSSAQNTAQQVLTDLALVLQ